MWFSLGLAGCGVLCGRDTPTSRPSCYRPPHVTKCFPKKFSLGSPQCPSPSPASYVPAQTRRCLHQGMDFFIASLTRLGWSISSPWQIRSKFWRFHKRSIQHGFIPMLNSVHSSSPGRLISVCFLYLSGSFAITFGAQLGFSGYFKITNIIIP